MPIHHNTPENPSSEEPYFEAKTAPLTSAVGTHAIDGSYDLPDQTDENATNEDEKTSPGEGQSTTASE